MSGWALDASDSDADRELPPLVETSVSDADGELLSELIKPPLRTRRKRGRPRRQPTARVALEDKEDKGPLCALLRPLGSSIIEEVITVATRPLLEKTTSRRNTMASLGVCLGSPQVQT